MSFFRSFGRKFIRPSSVQITNPNDLRTKIISSVKNAVPKYHNHWSSLGGSYTPLEESPPRSSHHYKENERLRSTIVTATHYQTRHDDYSDDDYNVEAKRKGFDERRFDDHRDDARSYSFDKSLNGRRDDGARKRPFSEVGYNVEVKRDHYDDTYAKRQRFDETSSVVQYAIKQPSQYVNPARKILENLFTREITADGWKKYDEGFEYHTKIRGKYFYGLGDSIDNAKERVAGTALKELCNFKHKHVIWPEKLLPYQLEQHFADEIERMVKCKFDEIMHNHLAYKAHKVIAGIVMTTNDGMSFENSKVVSIGTGTKCTYNIADDQQGTILHDMHAEVLARRNFVRFLFDELNEMQKKKSSIFLLNGKEIRLKDGVKFHLYINAIPCGDARVFSLKGCQHLKDEASMGSLRVKKIGGTEPISDNIARTSSMSCSDKIARWNILGLQGRLLSKFIKPVYLESIVLGSSYIPIHLYRSTIGRLENMLTDLSNDYCLNKPKFESTSLVETDKFASPAQMEYGICWSDASGYANAPEILYLPTGLTVAGHESAVSKHSFKNMFKSINHKLSIRTDEGMEKYEAMKKTFYAALKKDSFGSWEKSFI